MPNPYSELFENNKRKPQGEEFGGSFACQHIGCYEVAHTAYLLKENSTLVWTCNEGHESFIEDFEI